MNMINKQIGNFFWYTGESFHKYQLISGPDFLCHMDDAYDCSSLQTPNPVDEAMVNVSEGQCFPGNQAIYARTQVLGVGPANAESFCYVPDEQWQYLKPTDIWPWRKTLASKPWER